MDKLTPPKRKAKPNAYDWPAMRIAFVQGLTTQEISQQFNCPYGTVNARCSREKWSLMRPDNFMHKAVKTAAEVAENVWAARGKAYRDMVYEKAKVALEKSAVAPPKTWKDLEVADRVARRTIGLDNEQAQNSTIVNLAVLNREGAQPEPVEIWENAPPSL
jgi:hypothetical protein